MRSRFFVSLLVLAMSFAAARAEVGYPSGTQDFESLTVGQSLTAALPSWVFFNVPPASPFTVTVANDWNSIVQPRTGSTSTKWLRSNDTDATNVQNRYYSPEIVTQGEGTYHWTWYIQLETTPPGGADTKPKLTIQHRDTPTTFANAWGVEFTATGANLTVLGIGGTAGSAPLYSLTGNTAVGQWVKIDLTANFCSNVVSASANDGPSVSLPINLTGDQTKLRFCYRGEGTGNIQRMLVDDISFEVGGSCPTLTPAGMVGMAALMSAAGGLVVLRRRTRVSG